MTPTARRPLVSRARTRERTRVIYVMGAGRSGSTILGVALGNCPEVFYAGELDAWLRSRGMPNFGGQQRALFWEQVRENVKHGQDLFGEQAWRSLEHSLAPFRLQARRDRRRIRSSYRGVVVDLYETIARHSGDRWIVDSSHYPLRAREIQRMSEIDLHLIYLVREPNSVVASFRRKDLTNPAKARLATEAYLCLTHLFSVGVFLRHRSDKRLLLRYEDFAAEPERVIAAILKWLGIPAPAPVMASLKTGVPFQGNRLLDAGAIAFRASPEANVRSRAVSVTTLVQSPWSTIHRTLRPSAAAPARARTPAGSARRRPPAKRVRGR